jgi:hypothetical protein
MTYSELRDALMICYHCGITPFIWGETGLGKSECTFDLTVQNDFGFIDMRLSQMESTDLRGLPDKQNGMTVYLPPVDLPVAGLSDKEYHALIAAEADQYGKLKVARANQRKRTRGFLFLDELPRAQEDVQQACFQLVLNRAIGPNYVVPPGWFVVCAGNYLEGGYQQNGFTDPAFINRFCHLELSRGVKTLPEWIDYMTTTFGPSISDITQFASTDMNYLDGPPRGKTDLGFTILPSRRSWEKVHSVMHFLSEEKKIEGCTCRWCTGKETYSTASKWSVIAGLIGVDCQSSFKDAKVTVKPHDLLEKGIDKHR